MNPHRWTNFLLGLGVGLVVASPVAAQIPAAKASAKPAVVEMEVTKVSATVEAVDQAKRTVTLKGPGGRSVTLKVDETVKNFDQVKVGDKLTAEYFDATAIYVRKGGVRGSRT